MTNSLKKQITVFLILPVAFILVAAGIAGFVYARNALIEQWRQSAILRLERAAHYIDMRLGRPVEWIEMYHDAAVHPRAGGARDFILSRLESLDGVTTVRLIQNPDGYNPGAGMHPGRTGPMGHFRSLGSGAVSEITPPEYDAKQGHETVTLISRFKDSSGLQQGRLEVSVRFDYLMEGIENLGWWQSQQACLVDSTGRYLTHSSAMQGRRQLGETLDTVELDLLEQMQQKKYGTIMGPGHPPERVSGFYSLERASWVLIMYAPGKEILSPIIRFRFYYAMAGAAFVAVIVLLMQYAAGRMVKRISRVSGAFEDVKKGRYSRRLPAASRDEIGRLEAGFNDMVEGLKQRDFIRDTFGRYVDPEIARELLERPGAAGLGGEKREVVILMSDIRDFTAVAESLSPEETIGVLNRYFSYMIDVIHQYKGIIVDFYGDGVLVFFDPHEGPVYQAAARAVQCSLAIQAGMTTLNRGFEKKGLPSMETGIGIHAGPVVVGNIGSYARAKYGIVGSAVNITQRIQEKAEAGQIVISERIYSILEEELRAEKPFSAQLKGVQEVKKLYLLKGFEAIGH